MENSAAPGTATDKNCRWEMGIINDPRSRMKTLAGSDKVGAPIKSRDASNTE
jgi:hypothetical protein